MGNFNYSCKMTPEVVKSGVFSKRHLSLMDVGCSGGIDVAWRVFEPFLTAYGFDPQTSECERLQKIETNPNVRYFAHYVGLPDNEGFVQDSIEHQKNVSGYYNPWNRSSYIQVPKKQELNIQAQSNVLFENLTESKISISEFVKDNNIQNIDFIKIDTDGGDLEVLYSAENIITDCHVLGFLVETRFYGSSDKTEPTIANVDQFMRKNGFHFFDFVNIARYSRATLPSLFQYDILAQTETGPILWADALYLRDGASPHYLDIWKHELTPIQILKLACLFELFHLPDCAAEMLVFHQKTLTDIISTEMLLDLLVPKLGDMPLRYKEYMNLFNQNPSVFFPKTRNMNVFSRTEKRNHFESLLDEIKKLRIPELKWY